MNVIVIDDEKAMHLIMSKLLKKIPSVTLLGMFFSTDQAIEILKTHQVDLVFVDINMPKENGMTFAQKLRRLHAQVQVAFVTSHKDYALDAFELSAVDYLIKPISMERLQQTIEKARALKDFKNSSENQSITNELSVYTFGTFEVRSTKGGNVKFISKKSMEVFGYLLLHMGRKVSRIKLIAEVFPEMPQKNAETYLNTAMYQLRKSLEVHGHRHIVLSGNDGYELDLSTEKVDVFQLKQFFTNHPNVELFDLEDFLIIESLYNGELFEECGYLWAVNESSHYDQMYVSYALKASEISLEKGDSVKAIELLSKLMKLNKWNEDVAILLMQAYAKNGLDMQVKQTFYHHATSLEQDLGIPVSNKVTELFNQLTHSI